MSQSHGISSLANMLANVLLGVSSLPRKLGLDGFNALKAVLPKTAKTYAVGGVGASDFHAWKAAGVTGFGVGSNLYKPGMSVAEIASNAATLVAAYDAA